MITLMLILRVITPVDLVAWALWIFFIGGAIWGVFRNKVGKDKEIIEAEKRRRKTPAVQEGRFCSLFTMPYIEEAMPQAFAAYIQEHYPTLQCRQDGDMALYIIDERDTEKQSERYLYFNHVKQEDILGLRITNPNDVQRNSRYTYYHVTAPIDDKWPVEMAIREAIKHFQQVADEKKLGRKLK